MSDPDAPIDPQDLGHSEPLLASIQIYAQEELQRLLEFFFDEAEFRLIQLAQHGNSTRRHALAFETIGLLKRSKVSISAAVVGKIALFANPAKIIAPVSPSKKIATELELLDLQLLDAQLALGGIIRRSTQRWSQLLYGVEQRCAYLLKKNIDSDNFPWGIAFIARTLNDSLIEAGAALEMLPPLIIAAEASLMRGLGDMYDEVNEKLKRAGILPALEINQWPALQRFKQQARVAETQAADTNVTDTHTSSVENIQPQPLPPETHAASRKLLHLLRESKNSTAVQSINANTENREPLNRDTLLRALAELRGDASFVVNTSLLQRLDELFAAQGVHGAIAEQSADQLQLSEAVITELNSLLHDVPQLAALVQQLQIPLANAALLQPQLFEQPGNPAHQIVNTVGGLFEASDIRNVPFGQKISQILDPLTHENNLQPATFATVAAELARMSEQQLKARERSIQRLVETCEGQQTLAQAQGAVDRELHRRLAHVALPQLIVDIVQQGWRELLRITYLRNGEASEEWAESLNLLEETLWWFNNAQQAGSQKQRAQAEWQQATQLLCERIKQRLDKYFPHDYRHVMLVDAMRSSLQQGPIAMATSVFELPSGRLRNQVALMSELEQAYPDLVRWFRRARDFKRGDIFSHFSDTSRQLHTLAWVGAEHQHFVFVNTRGNKSFDFDLVDLARELADGFYPVEDAANWTVVERAVLNGAQAAYAQIAFSSSHDSLTGLYNRREFEAQLEAALLDAKNKIERYALLYIDIDQFALINDLHGHVIGDAILQQTAQRLISGVDDGAFLARMAGNEFAVLLYRDKVAATEMAETLRENIAHAPFELNDAHIELTISIGLVEINKYADSASNLLRDAIYACDSAKKYGRDRIFLLDSDVEVVTRRDKLLTWINKLNTVMESETLVLRAQPIVRVNNAQQVKHYEILLGLRADDGSILPPSDFIEAAECYNRMQRVDRWVVSHSFAWLQRANAQMSEAPTLSINLSANSLNDGAFLDFLIEQFGVYGIAPRSICFEVTETATIDNLANAADFIRQAKKIGCSFALDDFGTGRSSYEYLKQLPVDYLKIDGMFIVNIDKDHNDLLMVKSINEIAHAMGIKTIAEFVERIEILDTLCEIGVDFAQGYSIGKPVLLEQIH
ncbi:MAG: hypothetical protein JWM78_2174 [Verrucomicrobiaceae bacterium]|nr:hypothetical protein [Verrucomicrobiaceae bacterium]